MFGKIVDEPHELFFYYYENINHSIKQSNEQRAGRYKLYYHKKVLNRFQKSNIKKLQVLSTFTTLYTLCDIR